MKNIKLSIILDTLFIAFACFSLFFVALRFFSVAFFASILLALAVSGGSASLFFFLSRKKYVRLSLKKNEEKELDLYINQLCLYSEKQLLGLFSHLFDKMQLKYKVEKRGLFLVEKNALVCFYFSLLPPEERFLIELYKRSGKGENTIVFGNVWTQEIYALFDRFSGRITPIDGATLYLLMKKFDCFPEIVYDFEVKKPKFTELLRSCFSTKLAKKFFGYGLLLLALSLFTFYPAYYLVSGCALIIYSILCKFFGKTQPKKDFLSSLYNENTF